MLDQSPEVYNISSPLRVASPHRERAEANKNLAGKRSKWTKTPRCDPRTGDKTQVPLQAMSKADCLAKVLEINELYEKQKQDAPFPEFIFIGCQSSGKSTLQERFIGFKMNITKGGIGTRRPLRAHLINDPDCQGHKCKFQKRAVNKAELWQSVVTDNDRLKDKMESEPLPIEVRSNGTFTMILTDLPGVRGAEQKGDQLPDGKDLREHIKETIKNHASRPNAYFIVCLEPTEFAKNPIIEFMDQAMGTDRKSRSCWSSKSIFVMNKFDTIISNEAYSTAETAMELLQAYWDEGIKPYLVYTKPNAELEKKKADDDSHKQWEEFMQDQNALEKKLMTEYTNKLLDGISNSELSQYFDAHMGFEKFSDKLTRTFLEVVKSKLPQVKSDLQTQERHLKEQCNLHMAQMKERDPETTKECAADCFRWLTNKVCTFTIAPDMADLVCVPEACATYFEEKDDYCQMDSGLMDSLRLNDYHEREPEAYEDIVNHFDFHAIDEKHGLSHKLFGGEQYKRQKAVFLDMLVNRIPDRERISDDLIKSLVGALGKNIEEADWHRPILSIVKYIMKNLCHPVLNWHIKALGNLFLNMYEVAKDVAIKGELDSQLRKGMNHIQCYPRVMLLLDDLVESIITSVLHQGAQNCHSSMRPFYTTFVPRLLESGRMADNSNDNEEESSQSFLSTIFSTKQLPEQMKQGKKKEMHMQTSPSRQIQKPLQNSPSRPEQRRSINDDHSTSHIKAVAYHYLLGLVNLLETNLSMMIDTFILVDLREALEKSTLTKAFKKLPPDSEFKEYTTVDQAIEALVNDDQSESEARDKLELEKMKAELQEINVVLNALQSLEMISIEGDEVSD